MPRRRLFSAVGMFRAATLIAILAGNCLTGCAITPAAKNRLTTAPTSRPIIAWPAVETADLNDLAAIAPNMLYSRMLAYEVVDGRPRLGVRKFPEYKVHETKHAGVGLIRLVSVADPLARVAENDEITLEFICVPSIGEQGDLFGRDGISRVDRVYACVDMMLVVPNNRTPRGILVALRPAQRSSLELSVLTELLRDGWLILECSVFPLHPSPRPLDLRSEDDIQRFAEEFAAGIDGQFAYCAYAVEAALDMLTTRFPEWPRSPTAIIGMSMGALGVPTVAARLGDRVNAAVIIAGGANMMDITRRTVFRNRGVQMTWNGGDFSPTAARELSDAYLAASRLDPYHTAPLLATTPTLVIDGMFDAYVPPDTTDVLCERLNRPERWRLATGHTGVFLALPWQKRAIRDWIDRHVPPTE